MHKSAIFIGVYWGISSEQTAAGCPECLKDQFLHQIAIIWNSYTPVIPIYFQNNSFLRIVLGISKNVLHIYC